MDTVENDSDNVNISQEKSNKQSPEDVLIYAKAVLSALEGEQEDDDIVQARQIVTYHIKEEFKKNGGVPINTKDLLPVDLTILTGMELVNICDNIDLHLSMTRKSDLTSRGFSTFASLMKFTSLITGVPMIGEMAEQIERDRALRDSVVQSILGKGVNPPPLVVTGVILSDYIANILYKAAVYLDGRDRREDVVQGTRPRESIDLSKSSSSD